MLIEPSKSFGRVAVSPEDAERAGIEPKNRDAGVFGFDSRKAGCAARAHARRCP
jgi:hypothetical protein